MKRGSVPTILNSTFLSCEKDLETIIKKLFIDGGQFSRELKKLLLINTNDCLENNSKYDEIVNNTSVKELIDKGYVRIVPKLVLGEHEEQKSYLIISFNPFFETTNPEFRECEVTFDIFCPTDKWDLGNYRLRPFKIAGIIDGILDNCKLSGIGTLNFLAFSRLIIDNEFSGYTLTYKATHGNDDMIDV